MRALERLRPKLINQNALHTRDDVGGTKGSEGGMSIELPFAIPDNWREICVRRRTVLSPEFGESVL
jgi:hypothetical protein